MATHCGVYIYNHNFFFPLLQTRSASIMTYAMCGFSSFGTMTILVGVWKSVDSAKMKEVSRQIPRIMLNANLACYITACIAGICLSVNSTIMVQESN